MSISGARTNCRIDSRTKRAGAQRAHGTSRLRMLRPMSALREAAVRPISALRLAAVRPSSVLFARARLTRSARPLPMLHYVPQSPPGGYSVRMNLAGAAEQGPVARRIPGHLQAEHDEQRRHDERGGHAQGVLPEPGAAALPRIAGAEQLGHDVLAHADVVLAAVREQVARPSDLDDRGAVAVGDAPDHRRVAARRHQQGVWAG